MTKPNKSFKYEHTCDLNLIKECSVTFKTNRKNRRFCCDAHRYIWHNNMKALFRRMSILEESMKKAFSDLGYAIEKNTEALKKLKNSLKDQKGSP